MLVFTRYPELNFTWFILKGATPIDEWIATLNEYANQGLTKYELYDLRNAQIDAEQYTSANINRIVNSASMKAPFRPPGGKTAIVAKEDVVFGLSRMYNMLSELDKSITWETNVLRSLADAAAWLGENVKKIVLGESPN